MTGTSASKHASLSFSRSIARAGGGFDDPDNADNLFVTSGNTCSGAQLSGDYMSVQGEGAVAQDTALTHGAWQDVAFNRTTSSGGGGGLATGTSLGAGAKQFVHSGGTATGSLVSSGATAVISGGGVTSGATAWGDGFYGQEGTNDGAVIVQGGASSIAAVVSGGYLSVQGQDALSEGAIITANGWQDVGLNNRTSERGGGVARKTTLVSGGKQYVDDGGLATHTTIGSGGSQEVQVGGKADHSYVAAGGSMTVHNWASSHNTVVENGGTARIEGNATETVTAGTGSGVTVWGNGFGNQDGAGFLSVGSGGTAFNEHIMGGYLAVEGDGATSIDAVITNYGWQDVAYNRRTSTHSYGVAYGTKLSEGTNQFVYSGGTANKSQIASGASSTLFSGGVASGATAWGRGFHGKDEKWEGALIVQGGATSTDAVISGGYLSVQGQNAFSEGAIVTAGGWQDVGLNNRTDAHGGGTAIRTTLVNAGKQFVDQDAVAIQTIVSSGGSQNILANGKADQTQVSAGGSMNVESWGSSHNTVAAAGGSATVQRNATETVTLGSGSGVTVFGDGFDNQDNTGVIAIGSGGTGFNQIANGGYICVEGDGATSVDALVTGNGWQDVAHNGKTGTGSLGFATGTKLTQGGRQYVYSNGTAADTSVGSSGLMMVISGGTALNAAVAGAGNVEIQPGGSLSGGVVEDLGVVKAAGGRLGGHIDVAGYIGGGTIIDQGVVDITSGGVASQIVVASGGSIHIDPGGRISNGVFLQVGGHATVDASVSGTVDLAQDGYARLIVTGRTNPKLVISGFNGARKDASDQIVLRDIPRADIMKVDYPDVDHVAFTLQERRNDHPHGPWGEKTWLLP